MCCDLHEVPLLDQDVDRLAAFTGRTPDEFVDDADGWRLLRGAGTEPGGCVFFGAVTVAGRTMNGCTVHDGRPSACRTYPFVLRRGADGAPIVGRDEACPYRNGFPTPPGIKQQLTRLWDQLAGEREARLG